MSLFWTVYFPLFVIAVIWYGYSSGGFTGEGIQNMINPLLRLGSAILNFIFGV